MKAFVVGFLVIYWLVLFFVLSVAVDSICQWDFI